MKHTVDLTSALTEVTPPKMLIYRITTEAYVKLYEEFVDAIVIAPNPPAAMMKLFGNTNTPADVAEIGTAFYRDAIRIVLRYVTLKKEIS